MSHPVTKEADTTAASPTTTSTTPDRPNPRLTRFWKLAIGVLTILGTLGAMNQVFFWNLFNLSLETNSFLYLMCACFLPIVLIVRGAVKYKPEIGKPAPKLGVPWYDVLLIITIIGSSLWFSYHGPEISEFGWALIAPQTAVVLSFVYWAIVLEILRRGAGWVVAALAALVSLYPLFAGSVPVGVLQGIQYDFPALAQQHAMGVESILGLPLQTAATVLIGFMLFGTTLQHTGGAQFFNDIAMAIFGRFRGGSAKVSVSSSAAMGMMSGSAVSNVLTTGPMTIPAMIKSGFTPRTAGAVEATASSGGSITPPIMGTAAFLMVSFVGVPYTEILIAAAIPAALYFLGIYMQIDGYSARRGLKGAPASELPRIIDAIKSGWPFIVALGVLTLMLLTFPSEAQVPYYVIAFLLFIAWLSPNRKFGLKETGDLLLDAGKSLGQIIGIIAGVGLILGGLSATGVALSLSRDLIVLVGDNAVLILIAGALACFVLGMGLTISAAYVFLAIVMVPAVTALGINPIAAHLFVIYWASVSYITPPVGLAAFAAAGISKDSPMATSVEAMKFGAVKYIVPFGFAFNPALVAQGANSAIFIAAATSVIAVFGLSAMFSGWVQFAETKINLGLRILMGVGGFMVFLPQLPITLAGIGIVVGATVLAFIFKKATHGDSNRPNKAEPEKTNMPANSSTSNLTLQTI